MTKPHPYSGSRAARFIAHRILELRPRKSQQDIAAEAGFVNPNMLSMVKSGKTKLPLDRVPSLAKALESDPKRLFLLALQQGGNETTNKAMEEVFGTVVTDHEVGWLEEIRSASDYTNPRLTARSRNAIRGIFRK